MNVNVRYATPQEAKANKRKQRIMLRHGINVKVDGSWGPWQEEHWNKLRPVLEQEKATRKEKAFEFLLGLLLLIPSILGAWAYIWALIKGDDDFSVPIFLGLMAIAGVLVVKDTFRFIN